MGVYLVSLSERKKKNGEYQEYRPCDVFKGISGDQMVEVDCRGQQGEFLLVRDERNSEEYFGLCEVKVKLFQGKHHWYVDCV